MSTSQQLFRAKCDISASVQNLRVKVEKSLKDGNIAADYSLGFTNALIWADHKINGRKGEPHFYERVGSIRSLPKPVCLITDNAMKNTDLYLHLREDVVLAARNVIHLCKFGEDAVDISDEAVVRLFKLKKSLDLMADFMRDYEEVLRVHQETTESQPNDDGQSAAVQETGLANGREDYSSAEDNSKDSQSIRERGLTNGAS